MDQQIRNQIIMPEPQKRPDNDNIVAQFLGSLGGIGQGLVSGIGQVGAGVGQAIGQAGTGIATGIEQGVGLIGQGVSEMNKTPEGRLALRELVGAALRGVGQEDLGVGVQQFAKRVYQPETQRALFETQQRAETKKAERKAAAEAEKAEKDAKKQITKLEDDYRKEYNTKKIVKDSKEINSAISRMDNVWNKYQSNPNPRSKNALDQALVITFNKMLDPGSVVRESEFARTPQGQSLISRIQGASEKLAEGGVGLTDAERDEIIVVAKQLQEGQMIELEKEKEIYRELAQRRGLNIDNIIGKNKIKPAAPKVYDPQTGEFK